MPPLRPAATAPTLLARPRLRERLLPVALLTLAIGTLLVPCPGLAADQAEAPPPPVPEMTRWIGRMKEAPRGPFARIRWFCKDGTILPPGPNACKEHGGGAQHGEWSERTVAIRAAGLPIATVLADLDVEGLLAAPDHPATVKAMLLERFLMAADRGWIFRRASFYRGALQDEGENRGGRRLLQALTASPQWRTDLFPVLREATRLLPHGNAQPGSLATEVRQRATALAESDPTFAPLRNKMHVRPEASDGTLARTYTEGLEPDLARPYTELADLIDRLFQPTAAAQATAALAAQVKGTSLRQALTRGAADLAAPSATKRFRAACHLLATLREAMASRSRHSLALLDCSLELERELLRLGGELRTELPALSRHQRLALLADGVEALYGTGLLANRQRQALNQELTPLLAAPQVDLTRYQQVLDALARLSFWAGRNLRFHFQETMDRFAAIEPLSRRYVDDRLHASPLTFLAEILDSLLLDSADQLGIHHSLFGTPVGAGLQPLNAGLGRGRLHIVAANEKLDALGRDTILVLPATTEDLPPVAGILTAGKGNSLSHVQLLARNLGIPNVAMTRPLIDRLLRGQEGREVVLAVSPGGVVLLAPADHQWDSIFSRENTAPETGMESSIARHDLTVRAPLPLSRLRAVDAGRLAGPKAANLGELQHSFPESVSPGVVLPFGTFRAFLDLPMDPGGPSAHEWLKRKYAAVAALADQPAAQAAAARKMLQRIRTWILATDPGDAFHRQLKNALAETFGPDHSYGVFVRSDTNVEDLPGFTGAGLNLTVPNVRGTAAIAAAIQRVWASPFTERAHRWRQLRMAQPEELAVSVLLQRSVASEKSGVLVTTDIDNGDQQWLSVAVNEGVGGAVAGQAAEELRININDGRVRLLALATEPRRAELAPDGGVVKVAASGKETVLSNAEVEALRNLAHTLPERFPDLVDQTGQVVPAEVEFGFARGRLMLFQIRPFLTSIRARQSALLQAMDQQLAEKETQSIDLNQIPQQRAP